MNLKYYLPGLAIGLSTGICIGLSIKAFNMLSKPIMTELQYDIEQRIKSQEAILAEQNSALQKCRAIILANNEKFSQYVDNAGGYVTRANDELAYANGIINMQNAKIAELQDNIDKLENYLVQYKYDRDTNGRWLGDKSE